MFEMAGKCAIFSGHRPSVIEHPRFPHSHIHHRFDCQNETGPQFQTLPGWAEVRDLRCFVQILTDSVTNLFPDQFEWSRGHVAFNGA